jgi:hypothetical protein
MPEVHMKTTIGSVLFALFLLAVIPRAPWAESDAEASENRGREYLTLIGCLQKGRAADQYLVMGEDGSTWELEGNSRKFAAHVGQSVRIAGPVVGGRGLARDGAADGNLHVAKLKKVSGTCP